MGCYVSIACPAVLSCIVIPNHTKALEVKNIFKQENIMLQLTFNVALTLTGFRTTRPWGPFLERPGNLTGPISHFQIKVSRRVGCVLTSNEVHFVSLTDNFTVPFSKLLKLPSLVENKTV